MNEVRYNTGIWVVKDLGCIFVKLRKYDAALVVYDTEIYRVDVLVIVFKSFVVTLDGFDIFTD